MPKRDLNLYDIEEWHQKVRELLHLFDSYPDLLSAAATIPRPDEIVKSKRLEVKLANKLMLTNPVMVGAGWDKAGVAVGSLVAMGFSGVEVGSVQNYPQDGNPRPRHLELANGVTINRYGFNSPGAQAVADNLKSYEKQKLVIGINIGKNKEIPDVATLHMIGAVAERLFKYASYFVINVSSPNTPKLRKLQNREPLGTIVKAVKEVVDQHGGKPIFVKIAPDLTNRQLDEIIEVVLDSKIQGIVAVNSTSSRTIKTAYGPMWQHEAGGLSGDDASYRAAATKIISTIYKQTNGKLTIIGVGGVKDAETALEKIQAGASVVQLVTALKYQGFGVANTINGGLLEWMDTHGVKRIEEVIGQGA